MSLCNPPTCTVGTIRDLAAAALHQGGNVIEEKLAQFAKQFGAVLTAGVLFMGRAAAQSSESSNGLCPGTEDPAPAIAQLIELLNRIQELGVALGVAAAALGYLYCGLLMMKGDPESVKRAKSVAAHVTIGLAIVLVSGGLVEVIKQAVCPG